MTRHDPNTFDQALDTALHVPARRLRDICRQLKPAYARRNTIPVLSTALVDAGPTGTVFTLTDLDQTITITADDLATAAPFKACVPFKLLTEIAGGLDGMISVTHLIHDHAKNEMNQLTLATDDGFSATINLICPVEDFPLRTDADGIDWKVIEVAPADLRRLFDLSRHCISTEETRYYLNSTYLSRKPGGDTLRAAATDGHRLAVIDSAVPAPDGLSAVVPTAVCDTIRTLISSKSNEPVTVQIAEPHMRLTHGPVRIDAKLIDNTFPDVTRVIPKADATMLVTTSAAALHRLNVFTDERNRAVAFESGRATILNRGRGQVSVPVTMTWPDGEPATDTERWGFQLRYLTQQARVTPVFRIEMSTPADPATIRGEDPDALWVLMPMRM